MVGTIIYDGEDQENGGDDQHDGEDQENGWVQLAHYEVETLIQCPPPFI